MNRKGTVLIISLWILAILSLLAIGIGHQLSLGIKLLHNHLDSTKAFYIAKAGIMRAIVERAKVLESKNVIYADSFNQPWLNNAEIFKDAKLADGTYTIGNFDAPALLYGMSDEQAKININTAPVGVLTALLKQAGVDDAAALSLATAIKDWRDKNSRFNTIEEILLVKDMKQEIFLNIAKYITVFGNGSVNINIALKPVLIAILGEGLANYIINTREGLIDKSGGRWFVDIDPNNPNDPNAKLYINENDAKVVNLHNDTADSALGGSDTERAMLWNILRNKKQEGTIGIRSSIFRINSTAEVRGIKRTIETVVEFTDDGQHKFIYWCQQ